MQLLSETQIDNLSEQFETSWCIDCAGVDGIISFLRNQGVSIPLDRGLSVNLIEIDIERIWMSWDKKLTDISLQADATAIVHSLRSLPEFSSYNKLFLDNEEFEAASLQLAVCESRCRDQWGDAIGNYYYRRTHGLITPPNVSFESRKLRCEFDEQREVIPPTFPLRGCNVIGRQRSFDAVDCFAEELPLGNRIVVAGFTEAIISREQLSIQLLSPKLTVVTNLSKVNPLHVASLTSLDPGQSVIAAYPFSIRLPGRRLYCW